MLLAISSDQLLRGVGPFLRRPMVVAETTARRRGVSRRLGVGYWEGLDDVVRDNWALDRNTGGHCPADRERAFIRVE
jgi:hypothetical protein